jgi:cytoskeletal protein RodZ
MEDLGRKLKEAREAKGLSVAELSEQTKIREHYILDIEKGELSGVSPVYAKSFVETIARALGIDTEEYRSELDSAVARMQTVRSKTQAARRDDRIKNSIKGSDKSFLDSINPSNIKNSFTKENIKKTVVILLGLLGLIVVYVVYFDADPDRVTDPILTDSTSVSDTTYIDVDADEIEEDEEGLLDGMFSGRRDSMELTAVAIDSSWVKIVMDGNRADEKLIVPGEEVTWRAKEFFTITQGNVGALEIRRNGKLLEPFGAKGTVVKGVRITENEVKVP